MTNSRYFFNTMYTSYQQELITHISDISASAIVCTKVRIHSVKKVPGIGQ